MKLQVWLAVVPAVLLLAGEAAGRGGGAARGGGGGGRGGGGGGRVGGGGGIQHTPSFGGGGNRPNMQRPANQVRPGHLPNTNIANRPNFNQGNRQQINQGN